MIGVVLVCENFEAEEMLKTLDRLLGQHVGMTSVILDHQKSTDEMRESLKVAIEMVDRQAGVLLLTDFFGSTQCRVCTNFVKEGAVEILTGYNLPMIVKLASVINEMSFKDLVPFIEEYGKSHIQRISSKQLCP